VNYFTAPTFTLIGGGASNTGSVTGTATLVSNVSGGLTKTGNGSLTLTGYSTYSGATTVSAGSVILSGSGAINGSSAIAVNGSGAKLVQTSALDVSAPVTVTNGTVDGTTRIYNVEVGNGTGGIVANGNGGTGAFTIDTLTFDGGATINLNTATTSPVLITTDLTTGTVNAAAGIIVVNASNTTWNNGSTYDLISYSNLLGTGFSSFVKGTVSGLTSRQSATLTNPSGLISLAIAGDNPKWTGAVNGNWTTNTIAAPKNWKLITGGTTTDFLTTDTVLFDDSATGTTTVSISSANVNPSIVSFNNSSLTYTISSAGGFGIASGSLSMNGSGTVTINTNNTYTGGTTVNAGTLNMTGNNNFGAGIVTVNGGSATFSGNNTYSGGTTITGGSLVMSGSNTFGTGGITVNGGAITLSGVNTYTGLTTLNNGTLNVNGSAALGSAATALTITGGTLANTSGGDILLSTAKPLNWNGDFSFTGPNILDFNQGAVTIGGTAGQRTVNVTAGTLSTGIITAPGGYGLTKTGAGNLAMTSTANTTTINGLLDVQAGKLQTYGDLFLNGGLNGTGTIENGGAASKWIYYNTGSDFTFGGTIQDNPNNAAVRLGLVKRGAGTLTLTGTNNSYTDRFAIEAGKVVMTGTNTTGNGTGANQVALIGSVASTNGILEINGGTFNANKTNNPSIAIGAAASGSGLLKMTSGAVNSINEFHVGNGNGAVGTEAYAALRVSGGTLTSGSWLVVGLNNDRAVLNQTGGSIVVSANRMTVGAGGANAVGVVNMSGGTFTNPAGIYLGEYGTGTLNVSGTAALSMGTMEYGTNNANFTSPGGTVNLLGGTLSTGSVTRGNAAPTAVYLFNFNGGTLKATANNASFFNSLANTTTYVYNGGGTIDDGGFNVTIAQPISRPTGNGVSAIGLVPTGGGFIDTPLVQITGDGVGASAVADIDSNGNLTGITITNPGVGYTTAPTFTLVGGGVGNSGSIGGTATLVANTSGTITKTGAGTLSLNGTQDYDTLTTTAGTTNLNVALGTGSSTLNANATTNIGASQTLSTLNIGAGAVVTFGDGPFAFGFGDAPAAAFAGSSGLTSTAVVPEPGSIGLLAVSAVGLLARRRRKS
jgi:autotransporter-associated beta strand protein